MRSTKEDVEVRGPGSLHQRESRRYVIPEPPGRFPLLILLGSPNQCWMSALGCSRHLRSHTSLLLESRSQPCALKRNCATPCRISATSARLTGEELTRRGKVGFFKAIDREGFKAGCIVVAKPHDVDLFHPVRGIFGPQVSLS
jgi:hypothetical protein